MSLKLVVLMLLGVGAGLWAASRLGLPLPWGGVSSDVPPPLVALHSHFAREGLPTRVGLVRREHTGVRSRALFQPREFDGPFTVMLCENEAVARKLSPQVGGTATRGPFILTLGPEPADPARRQAIIAAFERLDLATALQPGP